MGRSGPGYCVNTLVAAIAAGDAAPYVPEPVMTEVERVGAELDAAAINAMINAPELCDDCGYVECMCADSAWDWIKTRL